ncbi:MAG: host attachment protein [Pseudomonadota bacterium]
MKIVQKKLHASDQPPLHKMAGIGRTWYLIANGQHGSVFEKTGMHLRHVADLRPTDEMTGTTAEKTSGHIAGGQGSVYYTSNPMDRKGDHDEQSFLRHIATWLEIEMRSQDIAHLVVAASPHALGLFREARSDALSQKITREIDKDYTHLPVPELESCLL